MIPKILWQTHEYDICDLPDLYKSNMALWKEHYGDWDYRYMNAKERRSFIEKEFPEYLHLYDFIKPGIYKADFWRYLVLYRYGGFYADMDTIPYGPNIIDLNKHSFIAEKKPYDSINNPDDVINNCFIWSSPKNKILSKIINTMIKNCTIIFTNEHIVSSHTAWVNFVGPPMYSPIIKKNEDQIYYFDFNGRHGDPYKDDSDKNQEKKYFNLYGNVNTL